MSGTAAPLWAGFIDFLLNAHTVLLEAAMGRSRGAIGGQDVARIGSSALVVNPVLPAIKRGRYAINGPSGSTFNALLASDLA